MLFERVSTPKVPSVGLSFADICPLASLTISTVQFWSSKPNTP